ncbi:MAG: rRNA (guanine-N1)-methyltransferase [Colwellia sp.]|nr:rRNA (guanine-N1)-methyltransferase [Colwellia sp.]
MKKLLLGCILSISCFSMAEDIELYVGNSAQRIGGKPKVLIIFDNSGSMENNSITSKTAYNPDTVYDAIGDLQITPNEPIYYTKDLGIDGIVPIPDGPNERRRFLREINGCASSWEILDTIGFYTGYLREHKYQGQSGAWEPMPDNNGLNIDVIDCYADVENNDNRNALDMDSGFPVDGLGSNQSPVYYSAAGDDAGSRPTFNTGQLVTLYTANYLRWSQAETADIGETSYTRLEIAQAAISDFIVANPNFDFGLQVFNHNHQGEDVRDGGRVVFGIQNMDVAAKATVLDIINNQIDGETNTPLCETLYEASRYFGGKSVVYGDDDTNRYSDGSLRYVANTPSRDQTIETGNNYDSPFNSCTKKIYTILITDGNPTKDNAANDEIVALDNTITSTTYSTDGQNSVTSHLAPLAYYMRTHDLVTNESARADEIAADDFSRIRNSTLSTIGFGFATADIEDNDPPGVKLLKDAAAKGGGSYYAANDPSGLKDSLASFGWGISQESGAFTSPAVATNNFDRTKTLNSIYYAMFEPSSGPRWAGNLKKLRVSGSEIQDKNNQSAIDDNGNISEGATSVWTTGGADGDDVNKGGVAQMLRAKSNRKFLSDVKLDGNNNLLPLTQANALNTYLTTEALAAVLNVVDDDEHQNIDDMLAWAKGDNVDLEELEDGSVPTIRTDVFGDPLHSKPLVLNYGSDAIEAEEGQEAVDAVEDIRILVGTNAGVLHMFADGGETVDETWAFMPKEFLSNISILRDNIPSDDKVYAIDGSPTAYISDENGDGAINGNDKVWLFVGLRRGGNSYYALDITDKNNPKFMWHRTYEGMGQSWSQPRVAYSLINIDDETAKPVLIFGAGYSIAKDGEGIGGEDSAGLGIYMVDAETGEPLWRLNETSSAITTTFTGTDSIPSKIGILDSDSDGYVDRLYAGDTGGNVWRVDMPGADIADWTVFQLASLGGDDSNTNDRRFFSQPTIVRALITETTTSTVEKFDEETQTTVTTEQIDQYKKPYEAILLGSGDATNPVGKDTEDKFFMVKDEHIRTQSFTGVAIPDVIEITDLKDYTLNPFQGLEGDALVAEQLLASAKSGWYIDFAPGTGEKSMSSAAVISGIVYFSSFTPTEPPDDDEACSALGGGSALYAVDLELGINIYDWRRISTGFNPPGDPTFVSVPDPDDPTRSIRKIIAGDLKTLCKGPDCVEDDGTISDENKLGYKTLRTHLYTTEK